jgi:hypothetical protein
MRERIGWGAAAGLMIMWLSWLGWQAYGRPSPQLISRPQVDLSEWVIVANLPNPLSDRLELLDWEVLRGPARPPGKTLTLVKLSETRGWQGSGRYVLPLTALDAERKFWEVTPLPLQAGYHPPGTEPERRIYLDTDGIRQQVRAAAGVAGK